MKLYDILSVLDTVFTPNTTEFSDYVKFTSDDNGFLRTCFCKKNYLLENRNISKNCTHAVVACEFPFDRNEYWNLTKHLSHRKSSLRFY